MSFDGNEMAETTAMSVIVAEGMSDKLASELKISIHVFKGLQKMMDANRSTKVDVEKLAKQCLDKIEELFEPWYDECLHGPLCHRARGVNEELNFLREACNIGIVHLDTLIDSLDHCLQLLTTE
jgi:hypothetical protein